MMLQDEKIEMVKIRLRVIGWKVNTHPLVWTVWEMPHFCPSYV